MKKQCVLKIDRDDLINALADIFARVLTDLESTRKQLLEGKLHSDIPDLTTISDEELIGHYSEFDLGFALLTENPDVDTVLIDLGNDKWTVAAWKKAVQQS